MKANNKSFTLIELLVVIVIIGILAGVIMISTSSSIDKANIAKIKVFEESVQNNLAANMVSAWDADHITKTEAGNWTLNDKWGNNNGTFYNGTGVVCSSTSGSEACPQIVNDKQMGNVLSFDGVDDYINLGNNDSLTFEGNFTISFWAYRTSEGYQGGTYIRKRGSSGIGFEMADSQFYLLSSTGKFAGITMSSTINTWENHVLIVTPRESPHIKHYTDANFNNENYVEIPENTGSISNMYDLLIGYSNAGGVNRYFNGLMDNVRIYNAALSSSQIKQNYIAGLGSLLSKELISKEEYNARIEALSQK